MGATARSVDELPCVRRKLDSESEAVRMVARNSPVRLSLCPARLSASGGDEPASATLRSRIFRVADAREDCDSGALHKRI